MSMVFNCIFFIQLCKWALVISYILNSVTLSWAGLSLKDRKNWIGLRLNYSPIQTTLFGLTDIELKTTRFNSETMKRYKVYRASRFMCINYKSYNFFCIYFLFLTLKSFLSWITCLLVYFYFLKTYLKINYF